MRNFCNNTHLNGGSFSPIPFSVVLNILKDAHNFLDCIVLFQTVFNYKINPKIALT